MSLTQTLAGAGFLSRGAPATAALRGRAEQAAAVLPPLLVAAERVAVTVAQGVHGRRRVGQGETFWQFRQYEPGDAATIKKCYDCHQACKDRDYIFTRYAP